MVLYLYLRIVFRVVSVPLLSRSLGSNQQDPIGNKP